MQNLTSFILDRKTIQNILRNCSQEMLVDLDMGEFKIYLKKRFFTFSELAWNKIFLKRRENLEKKLFKWTKTQCRRKKSRRRETPNLLTNADRSTDNKRNLFLRGTYGRTYRRTQGGGVSHVMLERWNLAGSSGGTRNSQKKCQLLGVNFDWFMAILVLKKTKTNMVERWNFEGSSRRTRTSHQK